MGARNPDSSLVPGMKLQQPGGRGDLGCLGPVEALGDPALKIPSLGGSDKGQSCGLEPGSSGRPVGCGQSKEAGGPVPGVRQGELREEAVQGEVIPLMVLPGPVL